MLEKEFKFYLKNQSELVKKYNNRYIVIKDDNVIGDYENELQALTETTKHHQLGTFLIQLCTLGANAYTETYHSRVKI